MRQVLEQFREWHANHFGDFSPEVNAELLCLDNAAEQALSSPSEYVNGSSTKEKS